jgi:hypothetical protein
MKKLKLGIVIANFLISKLGPYNYIRLRNEKDFKVIEFKIF